MPQGDAPYETMSGEAAYRLYAEPMGPFVESKGGRVLWSGHVESPVIGEGGDTFHRVALVAYPSRQAFLALVTDPFGSEIALHRASGLEGQW